MLAQLIELIYDASLDESRWQDFLIRAAKTFNAGPALLALHDVRLGATQIAVSTGVDAATLHSYGQHYAALNPWLRKGKSLPNGLVARGEQLCSQRDLERTEFYNDFGIRNGIAFTLGSALTVDGSAVFYLSLNRGSDAGTFDEQDLRLLQTLLPHLQNSMRIRQRLNASELHSRGTQMFPVGTLVVDRECRVLECNDLAHQLLESNDGLTLRAGKVWATDSACETSFHTFVSTAFLDHGSATLRQIKRSNRSPLSIVAVPGKIDSFLAVRTTIMLIVLDLGRCFERAEKLMRVYGFTAAEAALALQLLETKTLTESADSLDISRNTAKTQLNAIFSKTATNSQSELLRLLLCGPFGLRF